MHFKSEFILDRQHLEECYDQSQPFSKQQTPRIKLIIILIISSLLLLIYAEQQNHLAFFLLGLATVEYLSFHYRRVWWLTRQVWSKNSGNTITLTINDNGITTQSIYINSQLTWDDISCVDETEKGLLLTLKNSGSNYLSKTNLDVQVIDFIKQQIKNPA
jgi:hypothetical protein